MAWGVLVKLVLNFVYSACRLPEFYEFLAYFASDIAVDENFVEALVVYYYELEIAQNYCQGYSYSLAGAVGINSEVDFG